MADDEAPLAALLTKPAAKPAQAKAKVAQPAKAKASDNTSLLAISKGLSDETSLAALSSGAKAASAAQPRSKGRGKGKGQAAAKKRGASSSSSSSDSSDSDSSSSAPAKKKLKGPAKKGLKAAVLKNKQRQKSAGGAKDGQGGEEDDADDEEKENKAAQEIITKRRTCRGAKEKVVGELLCRWWYVMDDWPPTDEAFYEPRLKAKKLRRVKVQVFEWVPEVDEHGFRKVYELAQYPGLFRNSDGDSIDLRPQESCPCYENFMKKDLPCLQDLLAKAYENQLEDLKNSKYDERKLAAELSAKLTKARAMAARLNQYKKKSDALVKTPS